MPDLEPCPFCGNERIYTSGTYIVHDAYMGNIKEWCVYCYNLPNPSSCGARVVSRKSQEDAISKWNRRASDE